MSLLKSRQQKTPKESIEQFLADAPQGAMDMLRVFAEAEDSGSYAHVARVLGVETRTVKRNLTRLNELFSVLTDGGELFNRGSLHYSLTEAGKLIGQDLITQHRRLGETVMRASSKHTEAWLPITSNCIPDLPRLRRRVRKEWQIVLYPDPQRSADLLPPTIQRRPQRVDRAQFAYAMYSTCTDATNLAERQLGAVGGTDPGEVMVLRIEPFQLLAEKKTFGDQTAVDMEDVWTFCDLIVPDGGAVRAFLTEVAGAWEPVRQYLEGTDLDCCMACLRNHSMPDPAMIVHGRNTPIPEGFDLYTIRDRPELAAVTGVFHRPGLDQYLGPKKRQIWTNIWISALDEYATDPATEGVA